MCPLVQVKTKVLPKFVLDEEQANNSSNTKSDNSTLNNNNKASNEQQWFAVEVTMKSKSVAFLFEKSEVMVSEYTKILKRFTWHIVYFIFFFFSYQKIINNIF